MDPFCWKIIENIPHKMRRYEEIRKKQSEEMVPRNEKRFHDSSDTLGAPVIRGIDFLDHVMEMIPSPDYVPISDEEIMARRDFRCTLEIDQMDRFRWGMGEVRRHVAFHTCHEVVYFPMLYGRHRFETDFAKYLWLVRSCRAVPDEAYIIQLKKSLMAAAQRFRRLHRSLTINRLVLNDSMYCLSWFSHESRQQIIRILAETFSEQKEVFWISAENTELPLNDGIRLLLAISVTTGTTLDTIHIWHFFRRGALPITVSGGPDEVGLVHDIFIHQNIDITEKVVLYFYLYFVLRANYEIPSNLQKLALHTAYSCFENVKVLSVEYRYLVGGKGESLLYFGSIRNGGLRQLNILFTEYDYIKDRNMYVCGEAWKKAYAMCPCFRVNFIAFLVPRFDVLLDIMAEHMPLEGLFTSAGCQCDDTSLYFGVFARTLTKYYKRFIKRLNIHLIRPRSRLDYSVSLLLMNLPFLEELVYRGPIERVTSLHALLDYVVNNDLRIKKLHLHIAEDPCEPEPYIKLIRQIYDQYEPVFVNKGIDFILCTSQF